jgi:hypothetical protein
LAWSDPGTPPDLSTAAALAFKHLAQGDDELALFVRLELQDLITAAALPPRTDNLKPDGRFK